MNDFQKKLKLEILLLFIPRDLCNSHTEILKGDHWYANISVQNMWKYMFDAKNYFQDWRWNAHVCVLVEVGNRDYFFFILDIPNRIAPSFCTCNNDFQFLQFWYFLLLNLTDFTELNENCVEVKNVKLIF